uniref:Uncharacterized protein n=1 Tax=Arundo donax TaxID=35708 RepID=A0A0A8ZDX0_ARUDO
MPILVPAVAHFFGRGIGSMYRAMSLSISSTLYSPGTWDGCTNAFLNKSSKQLAATFSMLFSPYSYS